MAGKGPPRKPLKVLKMQGSDLAKNRTEPEYSTDLRKPPKSLKGEALKCWKETIADLDGSMVITVADLRALEAMSEAWGHYKRHIKKAEAKPMIKNKQGEYKSPHYAIADSAYKKWEKLMLEFGLTPASRTKVGGEKKKPGRKGKEDKL
jgi:P27 family predicted phage terminase small subunit